MQSFKEKVENELINNRTRQSLDLISEHIKKNESSDFSAVVVLIKSNLNRLNNEKNTGQINNEEFGRRITQIHSSILNLLQRIVSESNESEKDLLSASPVHEKTIEPKRKPALNVETGKTVMLRTEKLPGQTYSQWEYLIGFKKGKYVEVKEEIPDLEDGESQPSIQSSRDKTKYLFNGKKLGKGKLVLEVVTEYLKQNPKATFEQLLAKFPPDLQGSTGVINTVEYINEKYKHSSRQRHFMKQNEILTSFDNIQFAVSSQWGIGNIKSILELAVKENYTIEEKIPDN